MPQTFECTAGDTSPLFEMTCSTDSAGASPVNLTGATVVLWIKSADGTVLVDDAACTIVDAANGQIRYAWAPGDTTTAGTHQGRVKVTFADTTVGHFPNWEDITFVFDPGKS